MLKRLEQWSRWTILLLMFLLPWAVYGVLNLPVGAAALHKWLPQGKPERQRYERFLEVFGNDHFLIVSWDGCRVNDPRVNAFRDLLSAESPDEPQLVESVLTTEDVLKRLTAEPLNLPANEAASRLKGFLIGADGTASVVVRFTPNGISNQKAAVGHVFQAADHVPSLGEDRCAWLDRFMRLMQSTKLLRTA